MAFFHLIKMAKPQYLLIHHVGGAVGKRRLHRTPAGACAARPSVQSGAAARIGTVKRTCPRTRRLGSRQAKARFSLPVGACVKRGISVARGCPGVKCDDAHEALTTHAWHVESAPKMSVTIAGQARRALPTRRRGASCAVPGCFACLAESSAHPVRPRRPRHGDVRVGSL